MLPPSILYSELAGYFATISVLSYTPQVLRNVKTGDASNMSLSLLCIWLMADVLSLVACVLQKLLLTSILYYALHLAFTVILILQFAYYKQKHAIKPFFTPPPKSVKFGHESIIMRKKQTPASTPTTEINEDGFPFPSPALSSATLPSYHSRQNSSISLPSYRSRAVEEKAEVEVVKRFELPDVVTLLLSITLPVVVWALAVYFKRASSEVPEDVNVEIEPVGWVFGWLGTICSISGYLPQLWLNYKHQNCDGLALSMFLVLQLGCIGNILAIVTRNTSAAYLMVQAPVLTNSCCGTFLTGLLFAQFVMYRRTGSVAL